MATLAIGTLYVHCANDNGAHEIWSALHYRKRSVVMVEMVELKSVGSLSIGRLERCVGMFQLNFPSYESSRPVHYRHVSCLLHTCDLPIGFIVTATCICGRCAG